MSDSPVKTCAKCGEEHVDAPWYPKHSCFVCPGPCTECEGLSHHWMDWYDDETEKFYWHCKHCSMKVGMESGNHLEHCDCPDHDEEEIYAQ